MATVYVTPTGAGSADGSSWENAAALTQLNTLIGRAGAGGQVLLRSDLGPYTVSKEIALTRGGTAEAPVTITAVDGAGRPSAATILGTRDPSWEPGDAAGGEGFRLLAGANHLTFSHLDMRNLGSAFRVGADLQGLTVEHVTAGNVNRFFQNIASGANTSATVDGLVLRDIDIRGYADKAIFLQYDSHDVLIEDVTADAAGQHGQYVMGVHLAGTVHDVTLRGVAMNNNRDLVSGASAYRQGDGFTTERGVHHVRFEQTTAQGNTDAGYDLKSSHTTLVDAHAEGNSRNFRIWGSNVVLENVTGVDPTHQGGIGHPAQVWIGADAQVSVLGSIFTNRNAAGLVFDIEDGAVVDVVGGRVVNDAVQGWVARMSGDAVLEGLQSTENNGLRIYGSAGSDDLVGGEHADHLSGSDGNDVLEGGGGDDVIVGGAGQDTVSFAQAASGVRVSLSGNGVQQTGMGLDTISSVENVRGSAYADWLGGSTGANVFTGGSGDDVFAAVAIGSGADVISDFVAGSFGDRIEIAGYTKWSRLEQVGADVLITFSDTDTLRLLNVQAGALNASDFVWLSAPAAAAPPPGARLGTSGADVMNGTAQANVIYGLDGNDVLDGKAGADQLAGGRGDDAYHVDQTGDVVSERFGEGHDSVHAYLNWTLAENLEDLFLRTSGNFRGVGNELNNRLDGNSGANTLEGLNGDDQLNGHAGGDRLDGGAGADRLAGGLGDDTFVFGRGSGLDVISDFRAGGSEDRIEIRDYAAWRQIEQVGSDVVITFSDTDTLRLANVQLGALTPGDFAWPASRLGAAAAEAGGGTAVSKTIFGLDGDDVMDGRTGASRLAGALGDDTYYVDQATDVVVELAGEGRDAVHAFLSWTLGEHFEELFLRTSGNFKGVGNALNNRLDGNSGANTLEGLGGDDVLNGHAGTDRLDGGAGRDRISGGLGHDTFVFGTGSGFDLITDFRAGGSEDRIEVHGYAQWRHIEQVGSDVVITFSDGEGLQLANVQLGALTSADFLWT